MESIQNLPLEHIVVCTCLRSLHVQRTEAGIGYQHDTSERTQSAVSKDHRNRHQFYDRREHSQNTQWRKYQFTVWRLGGWKRFGYSDLGLLFLFHGFVP